MEEKIQEIDSLDVFELLNDDDADDDNTEEDHIKKEIHLQRHRRIVIDKEDEKYPQWKTHQINISFWIPDKYIIKKDGEPLVWTEESKFLELVTKFGDNLYSTLQLIFKTELSTDYIKLMEDNATRKNRATTNDEFIECERLNVKLHRDKSIPSFIKEITSNELKLTKCQFREQYFKERNIESNQVSTVSFSYSLTYELLLHKNDTQRLFRRIVCHLAAHLENTIESEMDIRINKKMIPAKTSFSIKTRKRNRFGKERHQTILIDVPKNQYVLQENPTWANADKMDKFISDFEKKILAFINDKWKKNFTIDFDKILEKKKELNVADHILDNICLEKAFINDLKKLTKDSMKVRATLGKVYYQKKEDKLAYLYRVVYTIFDIEKNPYNYDKIKQVVHCLNIELKRQLELVFGVIVLSEECARYL